MLNRIERLNLNYLSECLCSCVCLSVCLSVHTWMSVCAYVDVCLSVCLSVVACVFHACPVGAGVTTSPGPAVESQQAEQKRKKLSYNDPTIAVMEAQSRWDKLMTTEEEVSQEELKMSLFRGRGGGAVWEGRSNVGGEE